MSRRPPGETSSQGMPGYLAISPKRAAKLKTKKHREAERLFLAEGRAVLEEAPSVALQVFDRVEQLRRVSTLETPSGPVGVFPFQDVSATELLASVRRVVLLHGVQDPGNVGTAIRSAHAFGAGVALSWGSPTSTIQRPSGRRWGLSSTSLWHGNSSPSTSWPRQAPPVSVSSRPSPRQDENQGLFPAADSLSVSALRAQGCLKKSSEPARWG